MSSSEDYESESCPELDKSALLVAQVKLPCVFELTVGTRVSSLVTQGHFEQIRSGCLVAINSPPPTTINGCVRVSSATPSWFWSIDDKPS